MSEGTSVSPLVLVVEDHEDTAQMLELVLELHGFQVEIARCGREAVAKVVDRMPDAVSVDIGLPDMCGLELCRLLRQHPETKTMPILALTGWASAGDVERAKNAGCDVVLPKPCPPEDVIRELQRLVARRLKGRVTES